MEHYSKSGYRWEVSNKGTRCRHKKTKTGAPLSSYEHELEMLLRNDDKDGFLSLIHRQVDSLRSRQQNLLADVCAYPSVKCAEALIKGETPLSVNLNGPCNVQRMYPLHCAASSLHHSITELFLYYGARADVSFKQRDGGKTRNKLPLQASLDSISRLDYFREWTPEHSIYKLVILLCLPIMSNALETIVLLAGNTDGIGLVLAQNVLSNKIVEAAALLMVAHKRQELQNDLDFCRWNTKRFGEEGSMYKLIQVFDRMGDDITTYVKKNKSHVTNHQIVEDVTCLLQEAGFSLERSDTDLSDFNWYRDEDHSYPMEGVLYIGMELHSKSGYQRKMTNKDAWCREARKKDCRLAPIATPGILRQPIPMFRPEASAYSSKFGCQAMPMTLFSPKVCPQGVPRTSCYLKVLCEGGPVLPTLLGNAL